MDWKIFRRAVWIIFGSWWAVAFILSQVDIRFFKYAAQQLFRFDFTGYRDEVAEAFWVYLLPFFVFCFLKIAIPLIAGQPKEIFSLWVRDTYENIFGYAPIVPKDESQSEEAESEDDKEAGDSLS